MLELSENLMSVIGFDDPHDEAALDKLSRIQMIDFVCRMESEECLNRMLDKLKSHIDDGVKSPVNLEPSVFCFGLMASALSSEGPRLFQALYSELQASGSAEYRLRIINSLGCFGDVKVLFDFLATILESENEVENFAIIQSVHSQTTEGVEATLDFMIEFHEVVMRLTESSNLIESLVDSLAKGILNERLLEKVIFSSFANGNLRKFSVSSLI